MTIDWNENFGLLMMLGAAVALYVAARAAFDALGSRNISSPGARAGAHLLPIALTAIAATIMGRPEIAVGVIFATSVGSLSLVLGIIVCTTPITSAPPFWRRRWAFVLPASLLALLAGFSGRLTAIHALFFFIQGIVLSAVWLDRSRESSAESIPAAPVPVESPPDQIHDRVQRVRIIQIILAAAVGGLGAWAATHAAVHMSNELRALSTGLIAVVILGPLLTLPMIATGMESAQRGRPDLAATTSVGLTLMNLCFLLPLIILLWYVMPTVSNAVKQMRAANESVAQVVPATQTIQPVSPAESKVREPFTPMNYPMSVWRIDTVALIILGLMLLPAAAGRWPLGRWEGIGLIFGYVVYLLISSPWGMLL